MKAIPTEIPEVVILEPKVFNDHRGFIYESYNEETFKELIGYTPLFVQDNHSCSIKGVLRGLHYQIKQSQGKLVRVIVGEVFDVAVDLRKSSPSFGKWVGVRLSAQNKRQLWVPEGFAHGFLVLSDSAEVLYKATDYYAPEFERCLNWNDKDLSIDWPVKNMPILSAKDNAGMRFSDSELFV